MSVTPTSRPVAAVCECDLRHRAWNPNTGRCATCGSKFEDNRVVQPAKFSCPTSWDRVMVYVDQLRQDHAHISSSLGSDVIDLVLTDMRDREAKWREHDDGTPLTSGGGLDHLRGGYQEMLDSCSYFMNELRDHSVDLSTVFSEEAFPDFRQRWYLRDIQHLCIGQIRASVSLRAIIEDRDQRASRSVEEAAS